MMSVSLEHLYLVMSLYLNPQYCQWLYNYDDVSSSKAFCDGAGHKTFDDINTSTTFDDITGSSNSIILVSLIPLALFINLQ